MKIHLPVIWEMCGVVDVEAESVEDAVRLAAETDLLDNTPLPEGAYVDGSFALSTTDIDIVKLYQSDWREKRHA